MRGRPGSGIGELAVMPNKADKGRIGAAISGQITPGDPSRGKGG